MQLILRPISDSRLHEIIVTDSRFAIGRNEGQFKDYERYIVQKLSRRHARIFERDGRVYIADLKSSNGTTVNGQNVEGEPVQLRLNDEVQFGGLHYRVEHLIGNDAAITQSVPIAEGKIILKPVRNDGALAPIVVTQFPFLIGRYSSVFAPYQNSAREDLRHLLKHKRTYCPDALTDRERRILASPSWIARAWRASGKRVYLFVTRRLLRWQDREGAGDRQLAGEPR